MKKRELTPGSTFDGRYTLEGFLGRGSSGTVWKATDTQEERQVALKMFPNRRISQARIDREVEVFSSLRHPHILQFHRYSETAEFPYIDMELAEGHFHRTLQSPNRLSLKNALVFMNLTTKALIYAHGKGYMHRDLKPASLFYAAETIKVGDWGLAMVADNPLYLSFKDRTEGVPTYIAPEQMLGKPSQASDIYILGGLVAYEVFTGRQAIKQLTWYDAMARQLVYTPPPFEKVLKDDMNAVCEEVEVPIRKALSKQPTHRQPSMAEYRFDLIEAYRRGLKKRAKAQTIIDLGK